MFSICLFLTRGLNSWGSIREIFFKPVKLMFSLSINRYYATLVRQMNSKSQWITTSIVCSVCFVSLLMLGSHPFLPFSHQDQPEGSPLSRTLTVSCRNKKDMTNYKLALKSSVQMTHWRKQVLQSFLMWRVQSRITLPELDI